MGKVTVTLNGRAFTIGCEDGQEAYLRDLASHLDGHIRGISDDVGQIGDLRLLLMAALVTVDEAREADRRAEALEAQVEALKADIRGGAEALNRAAGRLEALAAETGA
ncbi:MAG: cell division protein ZapA [Maricaulaceae bacterium]|nr:cell division protein ZapA [Maricaulaceae bacterium]